MTDTPIVSEDDNTPEEIPEPQTVEPGQMWRDRDERSKGTGEFTVIALWNGNGDTGPGPVALHDRASEADKAKAHGMVIGSLDRGIEDPFAIVRRKGGHMSRIRLDRFQGRDYEYMGRAR